MKKIINKVAERLGFRPIQKRSYQGALINRLTSDWLSPASTADDEIRASLTQLRGRCRELERNNDYVRRFLTALESNILGHSGIGLQMKVTENGGQPDNLANDIIEKAWKKWSSREFCTVTKRMTWFDVQRLILRSVARDGDMIIRKIRDRNGFSLQLLEGDRLDINHNREKTKSGDNEIRMGVEVDSVGRPIAYYILEHNPNESTLTQAKRERIPASEIIHPFISDRVSQTRGTPWFVSSMTGLQMLSGYQEAELVAARVSASKMGFLIKDRADNYVGEIDENGQPSMNVEPGAIEQLPEGTTFQEWNPSHPTGNYSGFVKSCLRGISAGLGISYSTLANDLEGVNYSSIRAGVLDEREFYKAIQTWMIDSVVRPIFEGWLETNILNGTLNLPAAKLDKFNQPHWLPRRWAWVDPLKDQQASILAVENLYKSKSEVVAESGGDYEETLKQIKKDEELADQLGLSNNNNAESDL